MMFNSVRSLALVFVAASIAIAAQPACAQSLLEGGAPAALAPQPAATPKPTPTPAPGQGGGESPPANPPEPASEPPRAVQSNDLAVNPVAEQLRGYSLFSVTPAPPRRYGKHDLVEVIINESSVEKVEQTLDNKKNYDLKAELSRFPSFAALFNDLALREGIGTPRPGVGVTNSNTYKGEGKFNRKDQVSAKISATVIDVKPNGNLVLEARESLQTGKEIKTMVLSGICRSDDITKSNTLLSSQLANLTIRIEHEGQVEDTANKGLIPRILETIFNF